MQKVSSLQARRRLKVKRQNYSFPKEPSQKLYFPKSLKVKYFKLPPAILNASLQLTDPHEMVRV